MPRSRAHCARNPVVPSQHTHGRHHYGAAWLPATPRLATLELAMLQYFGCGGRHSGLADCGRHPNCPYITPRRLPPFHLDSATTTRATPRLASRHAQTETERPDAPTRAEQRARAAILHFPHRATPANNQATKPMGRRPTASNAAAEPLLPSALKRGVAMERCASRADDELQWFRSCLRWVCMDHSGPFQSALSWLLFLALTVLVPAAAHFLLAFRASRRPFSAVVQLSLSAASAAGFLCLSSSFRRIGLRRLLYLDKLRTKSDRVRIHYTARLAFSFRLLASLVAPCFAAEAAYKAWWYATSADRVPFFANDVLSDVLACSLEMASWMYRSAVYLLTCVLFRLICHLQGLRLEDFAGSLLEHVEEGRVGVDSVLREHLDIRRQLKVISHRFRKFIVAALLIATASQFAAVLLTTRHDSVDDLFNTGELALCSVVLMSGLIIILSSAAKITHQAQALTGHTTKWHACCTIVPVEDEEGEPGSNQSSMIEQDPSSDSDTESGNYTGDDEDLLENTKIHLPHVHVISFQKRQALVTYLENNRAGITVFGFTLDRSYLHTIFMLEWTLFLWLLGKTIGFS